MKPRDALFFAVIASSVFLCTAVHAKGALNDAAQRHFDAGIAYVDDPSGSKWDEALKEFRAAYVESPTWKLMNNIGLCALNLERDGEAIEAYREYLAHGGEKGLGAKQRAQIEKDITMLSASLVTVTISVEPADATVVDERKNSKGELLVNRYPVKYGKVELGLHPGHHKISMEAPGFVTASWAFDAEPSSKHDHQFKLLLEQSLESNARPPVAPTPAKSVVSEEPPKREEHGTRTGVYIGLAATGAFATAATVTGIIALNKQKAFDRTNDPSEEDRFKKSGTTLGVITDIGIGAAIVSAGITAYMFFTAPKPPPAKKEAARIRAVPLVDREVAGLEAVGVF